MRDEEKQKRHKVITAAAYDLLATKGYDGTSMLSISKAARASNETLYNWYGDKRGLFETMVRDNAAIIKTRLEQAIERQDDPHETLQTTAPILLEMLVGERAILLNRAAASDPSGELGAAISAGGRDVIQPLISKVIANASAIRAPGARDASELTQCFLGLLIGDLQIKRVIGSLPELSRKEIENRSQNALRDFYKILQ